MKYTKQAIPRRVCCDGKCKTRASSMIICEGQTIGFYCKHHIGIALRRLNCVPRRTPKPRRPLSIKDQAAANVLNEAFNRADCETCGRAFVGPPRSHPKNHDVGCANSNASIFNPKETPQ